MAAWTKMWSIITNLPPNAHQMSTSLPPPFPNLYFLWISDLVTSNHPHLEYLWTSDSITNIVSFV